MMFPVRLSLSILALLTLARISSSLVSDDSKEAVVMNYEFVRGTSNAYHFGFDSSDGISRKEEGKDDNQQNLAIDGSVSWVDQDGSHYVMTFKADKYGYRPIIKRVSGP